MGNNTVEKVTWTKTKTVCGNYILIIKDNNGRTYLERFSSEAEVNEYIKLNLLTIL